jgi:hypothetical protein
MLAPSGWSQQSKSADIRQRSFANERVKKFWIEMKARWPLAAGLFFVLKGYHQLRCLTCASGSGPYEFSPAVPRRKPISINPEIGKTKAKLILLEDYFSLSFRRILYRGAASNHGRGVFPSSAS